MAAEPVLHPDAASEALEAVAWYAQRSRRVAARFEAEVALAIQRIAEAPLRWPSMDTTHRKLLIRRFPYLVIYRVFEGRVWIVAVAHAYRRPGYWQDRAVGS